MVKKIFKEIIFFSLAIFFITNIVSYVRKPNLESSQIPKLLFTTIDGKRVDLNSSNGEPFVIHFWATWCPTCKLELSNIDSISKEYKVITVAVNSGDSGKVRGFMKTKDMSFDVINDENGELSNQFMVEAFPTTFILNANGEIIFSEVGYTSTAGLLARLKWASEK
jgi:thiol-disulfide isomerase/thioredoxin